MRSHGVPNFPDPSPGGPSVIPNWINPQAPAFLSAQKACAKFLGGGESRRGGPGEREARPAQPREVHARSRPAELRRPDDLTSTSPTARQPYG